jgi:uncharacterized membrane protein
MRFTYIRLTILFTAFAVVILADYSGNVNINMAAMGVFLLNLAATIAAFFIVWLILSLFWNRLFKDIDIDERIKAIESKSARNGYMAAFLGLFSVVEPFHSFNTHLSGSQALFLVLAFALLTFVVSYIYYFRRGD